MGKCRGTKGHARWGNSMSKSLEVGEDEADGALVGGLAWSLWPWGEDGCGMELSRVSFRPILYFNIFWPLGLCLLAGGSVLVRTIPACLVPLAWGPGGPLCPSGLCAKAPPPCPSDTHPGVKLNPWAYLALGSSRLRRDRLCSALCPLSSLIHSGASIDVCRMKK